MQISNNNVKLDGNKSERQVIYEQFWNFELGGGLCPAHPAETSRFQD